MPGVAAPSSSPENAHADLAFNVPPGVPLPLGKYEHLYRMEIDDGYDLGIEAERYRQLFNTIRPHEALAMRRPLDVHLQACKSDQILKSNEPETLPTS